MRVTKQVMVQNNTKIVNEASRLFREKGIEATSVADIMAAAGLTHGGFYRHFNSKDELASAAINKAFGDFANSLEKDIAQQGPIQAVALFIRRYLSEQHVINPGKGCPIVALGPEVNRDTTVQRKAITLGTEELVKLLALGIEGEPDETHTKATGLLATLVGTLVLARSAKSRLDMNEILTSGHRLTEYCLKD